MYKWKLYIYIYIYIWLNEYTIYNFQHFGFNKSKKNWKDVCCEPKHVLFPSCSLGAEAYSNDSFWCVYMAIWQDLTVGVWKGGFMVDTLWDYNFGPNVVFETFELYIFIYTYTYMGLFLNRFDSGVLIHLFIFVLLTILFVLYLILFDFRRFFGGEGIIKVGIILYKL